MFELKPLAKEAIPMALEKAERYRLLNEPVEAESICLDILQVDPENQKASIVLLLSLTDQFDQGVPVHQAQQVLIKLSNDYERKYYTGIVCERRAKAVLSQERHDAEFIAYDGFREAMSWYEKAEEVRPSGNDDALLRWNTCARIIMERNLHQKLEERWEPPLE